MCAYRGEGTNTAVKPRNSVTGRRLSLDEIFELGLEGRCASQSDP